MSNNIGHFIFYRGKEKTIAIIQSSEVFINGDVLLSYVPELCEVTVLQELMSVVNLSHKKGIYHNKGNLIREAILQQYPEVIL